VGDYVRSWLFAHDIEENRNEKLGEIAKQIRNVYLAKGSRKMCIKARSATVTSVVCLSVIALSSFVTIGQAYGQSTILHIPPDPNIGDDQSIGAGTQLNLFDGGVIGSNFNDTIDFQLPVEVNIFGGTVGTLFRANGGSTTNISGGSVGDRVHAFDGSTVNISGGSVGDFIAFNGSTVNLFGTQFVLDSLDITASLTLNEHLKIDDRDVTLSGLLADGSAFAFDLNSAFDDSDTFQTAATLTVTVVPEPSTLALAALGLFWGWPAMAGGRSHS